MTFASGFCGEPSGVSIFRENFFRAILHIFPATRTGLYLHKPKIHCCQVLKTGVVLAGGLKTGFSRLQVRSVLPGYCFLVVPGCRKWKVAYKICN